MTIARISFRILAMGWAALSLAWGITGCSALGYRLGSSLPPGVNVVHVPVLANRTAEPQLEQETTQAVIREFQREGSLSIGDLEKADVILTATLEDLALQPLRYERDAATATLEYRLVIRASLQLKDRRNGKVLVSGTVKGETDFVPAGDLSSAKRDALPAAAADLARELVQAAVEFW